MEKILVTYLSIGSGHQAGAEAVAAALRARSKAEVICRDPIAERSGLLSSMLNISNALSTLIFPRLYTRVWSGGQARSIMNWAAQHGWAARVIRSAIDAIQPDRIVGTHALPVLIAAHYKRHSAYKVIGVITDFGAHAYWPHLAVDHYCVPSLEAADDLIQRGIDSKKVHMTGLPIRSCSALNSHAAGQSDTGRSFISTGKLNVLMLAGGRRVGPYQLAANLIIKSLPQIDRLDLPIEITIVTGANRSAYQRLQALNLRQPIELLGLVDDMPARMARADVVVGKTGGVMIAETLASGAALIALTPGPGQEAANASFLKKHQIAAVCQRPDELIETLRQLADNRELLRHSQQAAKNFGRLNAADEVAQVVLNA